MEFGNRLYELRKSKGHSQEDLSEKLGVTRQTVSKWELGESTPDMAKLVAMGELFGISLDELVLGKVSGTGAVKRFLSPENKGRAKKLLRISAVVFAAMLAVDAVSFVVYLLLHGLPE